MIVYIAAPYTGGDVGQNIKLVIDCADELCRMGYTPYIPHLQHLWHLISPKPASFWCEYDARWLDLCDALLRLPGGSVGADNEVACAREKCIPVYFSVEELTGKDKKDD